jgi:bla regulator protein blaR1
LDNRNAFAQGSRFSAIVPLWVYVQFAYKLSSNERGSDDDRRAAMVELPRGVNTEDFEIDARASGNPTKDQIRLMMQSLLAERFKPAVHFETRKSPCLP